MKWQILAVGKPSLHYAKNGTEQYLKRLRRYGTFHLDFLPKDRGAEPNSERLMQASEGSLRVVLDERGQSWSTEELVEKVENWQLNRVKQVAFLIGGADGHASALRDTADHVLRLSRFTMQHELALLVLVEQLYRVNTVLQGEPYHRP
ncbi:MAG: 23S rRNA (pseudouridine(1915)-N(3))-methyltransferase RlmH [Verrucomicrobiota bacterium]